MTAPPDTLMLLSNVKVVEPVAVAALLIVAVQRLDVVTAKVEIVPLKPEPPARLGKVNESKKRYPVPIAVTVTELTAPLATTTVAKPPEPTPLAPTIGTLVNVPLV